MVKSVAKKEPIKPREENKSRIVLIIDDKREKRERVIKRLKMQFPRKLTYIEAENGQEGLKSLLERYKNDRPVGVVILDGDMPVMDGSGFLKKLRQEEKYKDVSDTTVIPNSTHSGINDLFVQYARCYAVDPNQFGATAIVTAVAEILGLSDKKRARGK